MPAPFSHERARGQGDELLFHYTTPAGVAGILDSGVLLLSNMDRLNDPREYKSYQLSATGPDSEALNKILRDDIWIGSFTAEGTDQSDDGYYSRGFGRARNWDQYAAHHKGAVLVFDREVLLAEAARTAAVVVEGPIHYLDEQTFFGFDPLRLDQVPDAEKLAAATAWRAAHPDRLYLMKSTDWETEKEYRIVLSADEQPRIPIATALRGIVLSEGFPPAEARVLATRLRRLEIERIGVLQIDWYFGTPGASIARLPGLWPDNAGVMAPRFDDEPEPVDRSPSCEFCQGEAEVTDVGWRCERCPASAGGVGWRTAQTSDEPV